MKILAVCGMGFGSSLMLKMTADRVLKKMNIKADVEACDIGTAKGMKADLILTNGEFESQLKGGAAEVVAIKNVVSEEEVEKAIQDYFQKSD